jgi:hypothetical protein
MSSAMRESGSVTYSGARGEANAKRYSLSAAVGFGPFTLPAGQTVTMRDDKHSEDPRVANIGNGILAAMKLRMLLDYRAQMMRFYGNC